MPGIAVNRFVDLEEGMASVLKCGICLEILDNAVDTECGHTFCKSCITSVVEDYYRLVCPECRHESTIITDEPIEWQLKPNRRINDVISKHKIRCDFNHNGCQEVIEYGLLSNHLKNCRFNRCPKCVLSLGDKQLIQRLRAENQELTDRCRQLAIECEEQKKQMKIYWEKELEEGEVMARRRTTAIAWPMFDDIQRCHYSDCWFKRIHVSYHRYDDHCLRAKLLDGSIGHTWAEGGWLRTRLYR